MPTVNATGERGSLAESREGLIRAGKAAALGDLTHGVAHELNNALLAILGLTEILVGDAEPGSRADRRLTVVRDTALDMRALLRALLEFARDSEDTRAPFDLGEALRGTLELVRRASSARDVELVERVPNEAFEVLGSRSEISQAVLHLLVNAFAALPAGGTVVVDLARRDGRATVTVGDSGPGVPPDLSERIFEPFFSTRPQGNGLGLAASRAITERHGGSLELRSSDEGATFALTVPLHDGDAAA
jgi:signal transduction histidine kinase